MEQDLTQKVKITVTSGSVLLEPASKIPLKSGEDREVIIELQDKDEFILPNGDLLIEFIEEALGDADVVEMNEINGNMHHGGLWVHNGVEVFFFTHTNRFELKATGKTTLNQSGNIADYVDTTRPDHLAFLSWLYGELDEQDNIQSMYDDCGWWVTDIDTAQAYKVIEEDRKFLFREHRSGVLFEEELNYGEMTHNEIVEACKSFGYSEREVNQWIENKENIPLMVECVFELL